MMKKIILWTFIVLISSIFILTAGLQLTKPEWFLIEVPNTNKIPIIIPIQNESVGEPYYKCTYTSFSKECKYVNLPKYQPYVVQTPYAPLYFYKNYITLLALILALILNWEKIKIWIHKIRTSSN